MSCSLEMVNCDRCGREVILAGIYSTFAERVDIRS